jgi:5-(carboxyamino)imidazole ribonucleotide synthase
MLTFIVSSRAKQLKFNNMNYFSSAFKLGILGGGQLGKMLLAETRKYDIQTYILDPSADAPAQFGAHYFEKGDLLDFNTVYLFGKRVDLLTIEIENVNLDALDQLESEGLKVFPSPKTLRKIQSKIDQKKIYITNQIPTAPALFFENKQQVLEAIKNQKVILPQVWKQDRFGYDGYGVKILKNQQEAANILDTPALLEELIPFQTELAVIVVRSATGEVKTYPVVEMEFHPEANQVEYVICPARISEHLAVKAQKLALEVSHAMQHVGLLAVEMFLTKTGEILVNEVAPRPHNSGHYSIEASYTSQFENHIRAILGLPLGDTSSKCAGIMVNLVGAEDYQGPVVYKNMTEILKIPGVTPHIYGKKETRPFRKMGHVTITHQNMDEARKIAQVVKEKIEVVA